MLRVFLVEDLPTLRGLLGELFDAMGRVRIVAAATTEAEAKLWIDEHPGEWDLALVDLVLDQGSGLGVVGHASSARSRGSVVVFSSYVSPGIRAHCLQLGADAVFDKAHTADFITWLHDEVRRDLSP